MLSNRKNFNNAIFQSFKISFNEPIHEAIHSWSRTRIMYQIYPNHLVAFNSIPINYAHYIFVKLTKYRIENTLKYRWTISIISNPILEWSNIIKLSHPFTLFFAFNLTRVPMIMIRWSSACIVCSRFHVEPWPDTTLDTWNRNCV